jgi:hypothetical protein
LSRPDPDSPPGEVGNVAQEIDMIGLRRLVLDRQGNPGRHGRECRRFNVKSKYCCARPRRCGFMHTRQHLPTVNHFSETNADSLRKYDEKASAIILMAIHNPAK